MTAAAEVLGLDRCATFMRIADDPKVRHALIEAQLIGPATLPEQAAERLMRVADVLHGAGIVFDRTADHAEQQ